MAIGADGAAAEDADGSQVSAADPFAAPRSDEKDEEEIADPFALRPDLSDSKNGGKGSSLLVLIIHYPEKDTVVELAMDTRMGSLQSLIAMAYLVQGRLLNRW